ncbi:unnamed protein product, partial [Laminaria digitata]
MYNTTRKHLNTFTTNCKQSGMGEPFWDLCQGDTDALYMQEVCLVHPELLEFTQTLLPETSRAEAGLGGAGP